jgi:hypothetical protein
MKFYLACTVLTKRKWERSQIYKHLSILLKRNTIAYQKTTDHDSERKKLLPMLNDKMANIMQTSCG